MPGGVTSGGTNKDGSRNDEEYKFFDTACVHVSDGRGANGCVAFRREKGKVMGVPNGGCRDARLERRGRDWAGEVEVDAESEGGAGNW